MFFWNSLAFSMMQQMLAIWSLVPLPFLKPAWTCGSSRFTYCWSLVWRILSITLLACKMAGWHHRLDGHEFEWTPGDDDGQGGLACCNSWGRKELDMTERLNWTELRWVQLCSSLSILWHCLSLRLERKLTFSSPVATAEFSKFAGILSAELSQHHLSGFEIAQLEFHHLH